MQQTALHCVHAELQPCPYVTQRCSMQGGMRCCLSAASCTIARPCAPQAIMRPVKQEAGEACLWVGSAGQVVGVDRGFTNMLGWSMVSYGRGRGRGGAGRNNGDMPQMH